MRPLTIVEVEYVAYRAAVETMAWDEPIPEFTSRFPNILESCLAVPFQTYERRSLYTGLVLKAAMLFYLMIKNHPFQNGNKRIALTTLLYFLYREGKWLQVDTMEFYNFAKWVAASNPKVKDATVAAIESFVTTYLLEHV